MSYGDDFEELIASAVIGARVSETGWIRVNCPLCVFVEGKEDRKRSFGFSARSNRYECYRCGEKGRLREAPEDYGVLSETPTEQEKPLTLDPPEGFYPLAGDTSESLAPARDYLLNVRKMDEETIARAGIGACATGRYHGRVVIPVLDLQGKWAWFVGRTWVKKCDRPYLYPFGARHGLVYNEAAMLVETDEPLLVMEGAFDAIAHHPHATAVLGKTTDEHLDRLRVVKRPVVLVPDGDEHDSGWALSRRLRLHGLRSGVVKLAPKQDPDEVDRAVLRKMAFESLDN